jgi:23S rRNA pseudouridine2457 synthase
VLSQFTPEAGSRWRCLADYISNPGVYAAGRLDADSEGLLLLTDQGPLQHRLTNPDFGHWRRYWAQVEGELTPTCPHGQAAIARLGSGVLIQGTPTRQARARALLPAEVAAASLPERDPPIRHRLQVPTSWVELELKEGRNRQVRRMTAAVGYPTLRLIRMAIDLMDQQPPLTLGGLEPGNWRSVTREEEQRLQQLLQHRRRRGAYSPGRGGRAGGGKSGRAGGGG